jgi:hypothetical protein
MSITVGKNKMLESASDHLDKVLSYSPAIKNSAILITNRLSYFDNREASTRSCGISYFDGSEISLLEFLNSLNIG